MQMILWSTNFLYFWRFQYKKGSGIDPKTIIKTKKKSWLLHFLKKDVSGVTSKESCRERERELEEYERTFREEDQKFAAILPAAPLFICKSLLARRRTSLPGARCSFVTCMYPMLPTPRPWRFHHARHLGAPVAAYMRHNVHLLPYRKVIQRPAYHFISSFLVACFVVIYFSTLYRVLLWFDLLEQYIYHELNVSWYRRHQRRYSF